MLCSYCIDVTGGFAQLNIQGPKSRELLQTLTDVDMSNEDNEGEDEQKVHFNANK